LLFNHTVTACNCYSMLIPPWKCSRPGWMGLWAAWSSGRCPCHGTRWSI